MNAFSIKAPNGQVSGTDLGEGPSVVLLAGLGSTSRIWGNLPSVLARTHRVITVDNRGVGGSQDGRPFTLAGAAEDLDAVLEERGVEQSAILGASMGGAIALHTALAFPARVSRLVIASSAARLTLHGRRVLHLLQDLLVYAPPERVGAALMTMAFAPSFHERFAGFVNDTTELYGPRDADVPGALAQIEHLLRGWDLRPHLQKVEQPALVLCGDRDPVVAPEDTAELADLLPRAELIRVAEAAHSVLAEGGEPILEQISSFLGREPGEPPIV